MAADTKVTITTTSVTEMGPGASCGPKVPYLKTMAAVLKYVELGMSLGICIAGGFGSSAGIYAVVIGAIHLIFSVVLFMFYFCNCIYKIPRGGLIQFWYYVFIDCGLLVAAIVGCVYANINAANGVAAAFAIADLIAAGFCTYFAFRLWRSVGNAMRVPVLLDEPSQSATMRSPPSRVYQQPPVSEIERTFGSGYNDEDDWED